MKVMNPGNIDAQPTASVGLHAWEEYVRAKLPILDLDKEKWRVTRTADV
jgi:hypothetical protein